ncbi:MAG: putative zinc-binding peptidase [Candidatus Acinetobacter avistercoris]|uniref:zinc-binding metallopeptidase family protein n=1 Tax=Acinetobacter sp. KS-LM10 TaxID=3120518 RepID=UPI001F9CCE23|nr:putative zinc-binding peptidase [Candidatus Acinetobacter avistercoris]
MKYFACANCQSQIFFANSQCTNCHKALGYVASEKDMGSFEKYNQTRWRAFNSNFKTKLYKPCFNYTHHQVCNWMIPADSPEIYCESCILTHIIPNLDNPDHTLYWSRLEHAKRRFLYLMQRLNIMPRPKKSDHDRGGLRFNFLMPEPGRLVITGHSYGLITLNATEADVVYRETTRVKMGENYRTLLGHFRHESGHYYFDLMQHLHPELIDEFRVLFGDERQDYAEALKAHYNFGAPSNWETQFISSYASTHPWEDWAETWAHYLHMMDTLETAYHAGLVVKTNKSDLNNLEFLEDPIGAQDFEEVLKNWMTVTFNLNALNRSMGLDDAYPFTLSDVVLDKLRFIHHKLLNMAFQNHSET